MRFGSSTAARRRSTSSCARTFATARSPASSSPTCTAITSSASPVSSARSAVAARRRDASTARIPSRCTSSAPPASATLSEPPSRVLEPRSDSRSSSPSSPRPETASRASARARTRTRAGSIDSCTSPRTADVACFSASGGPITARPPRPVSKTSTRGTPRTTARWSFRTGPSTANPRRTRAGRAEAPRAASSFARRRCDTPCRVSATSSTSPTRRVAWTSRKQPRWDFPPGRRTNDSRTASPCSSKTARGSTRNRCWGAIDRGGVCVCSGTRATRSASRVSPWAPTCSCTSPRSRRTRRTRRCSRDTPPASWRASSRGASRRETSS